MYVMRTLKAFLFSVIAFLRMRPTLGLPLSQPSPAPSLPSPPPSANDPETQHPESPPSGINLESSGPQSTQPSAPAPAPSTNDLEILQRSTPQPPTLITASNLKQLESVHEAQQRRLQLENSVLSFCFSYALAVSLQYPKSNHQSNHPHSSFVLLSFLVLLTFILIFVASFISPSYTKTSEVLDKAAFLAAAAAFCYAIAIPFPFELECAVLAVFLLSLLLITIFEYLNRSTPQPPTLITASNLKQLESVLEAQQRLQLKNSVLSFSFSYALAVSLQYPQSNHQSNHSHSSFVLLSFLVLLTFFLIFVASFISPSYTKTSEVLDKAAFLAAAAAFCYAIAIPFPFELECAVLAVFLLSLLLITIFEYLNRNIA